MNTYRPAASFAIRNGCQPMGRSTLQPFDIIEGAQSPVHPKVFVIGAFDSRITFYSQQVRALALVHALQNQGFLRDGMRIGVVGGGAAGLTAAAAVALISDATVDLYERADEVLPLQRATQRRRLDPHIYGWPDVGSDDPTADLPLLDWTAGSAQDVRRDVKQEFEAVVEAVAPRLRVNLRHGVTAARVAGAALQLDFRRDPRPGEAPAADAQVPGQATFDLLLLAFGFGLESAQQVSGVPTASYWSDAGVPVAEFEGRATPRFLISGNGDGGLIDLVAAASAHFDHAGMIREIVRQPNIQVIFERLEAIDARARAAFVLGDGFDFLGVYEGEILADLQAMGLVDLVASRLRPGVRLTLQTLRPEAFSIETATLNRVAAYLIIWACQAGGQTEFMHLHGDDLAPVAAPAAPPYAAPLWFTCSDQTFGVDAAIVRRGPGRSAARQPFSDVLGDFDAAHKGWLRLHGDGTIVPELSGTARDVFTAAARGIGLPPAAHVQRSLIARQPKLVRVQPAGANLRWSGDLAPDAIGAIWDTGANAADIYVPAVPAELGPVAAALVRLALHASHATLVADVGDWRGFADALTSASAHAEHLTPLTIQAAAMGGAARNPQNSGDVALAQTLHRALDRWMLDAIHRALSAYIVAARDQGNLVGFRAAADLRARMGQLWDGWRAKFHAEPALLDRFLRLLVCAEDDDDRIDEARVVVGPRKLLMVVRATAAALAVAAAWQDTAPRGERPGNLLRPMAAGNPWHGHACAAELIRREPMAIAAASFIWRTHFVVLSQLSTPLIIETRAAAGLADVDVGQPSLAEMDGAQRIILTLDAEFRSAAESSLPALTALLASVEADHFMRLRAAVEEEDA
ncbi:hypothetical protein EZH22_10680 [Xanthobacter dioxanivorans]|uniref:ABC-three component systems C-terminal domain-containing protein n=1 Tax=Xanthobacter dioxanivorans TaxID=2528964 RepID=A0A974PS12_9HYPH|nr:ABC-three component system protein [Xanthobacter dioxanivorans]QRG08699.1 hypothetical protein EZH22_10680 [Xanthobacter dioxanivorans]